MPPGTELQSEGSGGGGGNLSNTVELCLQGTRDHPHPGDQAARSVQSSDASTSCGPACGSCSLARDPGRVVWEAPEGTSTTPAASYLKWRCPSQTFLR